MVPSQQVYRSNGHRIHLTMPQRRHIHRIRESQRWVYNWAAERLLADPTLTKYDLSKEFTKVRRATPWLPTVERTYQNTAIAQARTAMDISNKYGKGNLKFRSRKRDNAMAITCDAPPRFVDNTSASLPGLGVIRLDEEQPYRYPSNWLYKARTFRLVDITPKSWANVKPEARMYRLHITYDLPDVERRETGVAAGIDRGITTVCKTDGMESTFKCHDTAAGFRENRSWNDGARRTISRRNRHSRTTGKMGRHIQPTQRQRARLRRVASSQGDMPRCRYDMHRGFAP